MTMLDTTAWVEFLRATGSPTHHLVRDLIADSAPMHTTDVVVMEILAGGRDEAHATTLRRLLARGEHVAVTGLDDFENAALLYRTCRRAGETVRSLNDCLIAVVTIRSNLVLLHNDRDFDAIARHSSLQSRRA